MSLTKDISRHEPSYDEDFEEKFLKYLSELNESQSDATYIMNPKRVSEFIEAYKYLKSVFFPAYKVSYNQHNCPGSTGWGIKVRGKRLSFTKTKELVDVALSKADCFEVSAYINGDTELAVTFYGMMERCSDSD